MTTCHFMAEDLESLYRVLDSVVCEVAERGIPLSVYDMIARLFTAAERGETSPLKLREAILRGAADEVQSLMTGQRFGAGVVDDVVAAGMRAA